VAVIERLEGREGTVEFVWNDETVPSPSVLEGYDGLRYVLTHVPLSPAAAEVARSLGADHMVHPTERWFSVVAPGVVPAALRAPTPPGDPYVEGMTLTLAWDAYEAPTARRDPFVNVHVHSDASPMDGLSTIGELVATTAKLGQDTVVVTDHGYCAGHADLLKQTAAADLRAVPGLEAYWVPDRHARGKDSPRYNHLILWAMTPQGLTNLWALSTEAHRSGFYSKPRTDWDLLGRYSEGIGLSTACLRGPLADPLLAGDGDGALAWLAQAQAIFDGRLWVEVHTNQLPDQVRLNRSLVDLAQRASLPLIAATDSHYPCAKDRDIHRLWLTAQTHGGGKAAADGSDDSGLFAGGQDYHLGTSTEVRERLSYLPTAAVDEAIAQTVEMAQRCQVSVPTKAVSPMFDPSRGRAYATERLRAICEANWDRRVRSGAKVHPESVYRERFEYEMELLGGKDFHDYFLVTADYVRHAKSHGVMLGPGRGSGSGSLVAYLADITEVDPVAYDLIFERFMTKGRVDPPDFDVDFPTSMALFMQSYIVERWGEANVVRVGSVLRMRNRKAIKAARQMLVDSGEEVSFTDIEEVCKIIEAEEANAAGLGKPFDVVMTNAEEALEPYRSRYPRVFHLASRIVGRIATYGKHASGMVISTSTDGASLIERLPMRRASDDEDDDTSTAEAMVTEFDYRVLEEWGFLKADFLFLRTLDTLQTCSDLVTQRRDVKVFPYDWTDEFEDPQVWDALCDGQTLGSFQVETAAMTQLVKRYQPRSILELADVITLVRPGPSRSGLTDSYLRRRFGQEPVTYLDRRLEPILAPTQGVMIFQEQIMSICRVLARYDDVESDAVRKLLGKKQRDKVEAAGRKFVEAAVANDTDYDVARTIWEQMVSFALYCVSGDTRVHLANSKASTGETIAVADLYRQRHRDRDLFALACHPDGKVGPSLIMDVVQNGAQRLYEVTLSNGMSIKATADHRHLTPDGYRRVSKLGLGDHLVVDVGYQMPTSFPIVSIVDVGEEMTYDVVMDEPHNFVANGIVTHNSFNKSHAVSYAILAFYCLWYRVHYPEEFFTAVLSTLSDSDSKQRVPDFVAEAQRLGFKVLPPDINTSGKGFTASEMAVRYGFGQIKGIGPKVVDVLVDQQPYASVEDFRAKMAGHRVNMGHVRTLAAVGAFDALEPNRRGLEAALAAEADGTSSVCVDRTADRADGALPCRYDWANEPVELTAKGKAKIRKVPARCTKACRHYRPGGFSITEVDPYTDAEVRDLEMERLGVWLSSSPFDRITDELWKDLVDVPGLQKALPGVYHMPGVLKTVRKHQDSAGRAMAFLQVLVKNDVIDVVAFSSTWSEYGAAMQPGKLGIYEIAHKGRDQRGVQLRAFSAVD
jgi:DNA polymerase-3 subunit alpha